MILQYSARCAMDERDDFLQAEDAVLGRDVEVDDHAAFLHFTTGSLAK